MKAKKSKKTKAIKQEQAKKAFDAAELLPDDAVTLGAPSSELQRFPLPKLQKLPRIVPQRSLPKAPQQRPEVPRKKEAVLL